MKNLRVVMITAFLCSASNFTFSETQTIESACFEGEPLSELFDDIIVIEEKGYVVGFSPGTRTPIWSCYRLNHVEHPPDLNRPNRKFKTYTDGDITVRHDDYTNSGFDRGHMAPSSGIGKCYGRRAQIDTFKTTNICPQHPGLNQRCWERFERQVSDYYTSKMGEVWIVTGPIFQDTCIELTTDVRVPDAFYKIVVAKIGEDVEMLGLIMPNERMDKSRISRFVHTVDEIEDLAGIDFFHELVDGDESKAESKDPPHEQWNTNWELRPTFSGTARTIHTRECD